MNHTESLLQHDIALYLQSLHIYFHSIPNEGAGADNAVRTMQLEAMGMRPGVADLAVWWPADGGGVKIGYMEVKTPTGVQSARQKHFQQVCAEHGVRYDLVRSVDDVRRIVDGFARREAVD